MPLFDIEWGIPGYAIIRDVIEAESEQAALDEAKNQAFDLFESNKIATAKPFVDKAPGHQCETATSIYPPASSSAK